LVILAYVLFNVSYAAFSTPAGIISDKVGYRKILLIGFLLFSVVYVLFGLARSNLLLWPLFTVYGIYMALTEGVGKAYISRLVSQEKIGTAFGIYQTAIGFGSFLASFLAGLLWTYIGVSAPFIFGGVMAVISACLFVIWGWKSRVRI